MSFKPLDTRQNINRAILQQLFPYIGNNTLDVLLSSVNQDLTVPLNVTATSSPSLVVNIGSTVIANSVSNRNKAPTFVNGTIPTITSATVTFPSASGGNITGSNTSAPIPLTLPIGSFVQVVLTIDDISNISATVGSPNTVRANLVVPSPPNTFLPFAYITLFNSGGVIQNVTQSNIFQIVGPQAVTTGSGGGSAGYIAKRVALSSGATQFVVSLTNPQPDLSYVVFAMMENDSDSFPQYQQIEVTQKTTSGFTFQWNAPLETNNYFINYILPPILQPNAEVALSSGTSSKTITLNVPQNGTAYGIVGALQNLTDLFPQFQTALITNQTSTTFAEFWNGPTSSANYQLAYISRPTAQVAVGSGSSSVTATLPVAYGSINYAVVASLSNVTDANPVIQPLVNTSRSSTQFTVSFNTPTPTANYILTYYAISLTS